MFFTHARTPRIVLTILALSMFFASAESVRAELSSSRARRALTRMNGFELTSGAVRVRTISDTSTVTADVAADIRLVFRFEQDVTARWRIAEVRTRPDNWEEFSLISNALNAQLGSDNCTVPDPPLRGREAVDPGPRKVRCLLAHLFGVTLPSDAIRVQEVEPFALPFASRPSATVVAWITVDARAVNDSKNGWRITELRAGSRDWVNLDRLVAAVNQQKERKALAELQRIVDALEKYRQDRGSYIVTDSQAAVIDHLSPKYLLEVIRLDPWHQPYKYEGQRDRYSLSSSGPDGKPGTPDDITRSK